MPDDFSIRPATPADAEAVAAIYNGFVATCTCTWQTKPDAPEFRRAWLENHRPEHPVFVATDAAGHVVAFAALSPYSPRGAFAGTAEIAIYLADAAHGRGLGSRLMKTLIGAAAASGLHLLIARISADQPASLALHAKFGFTESGRIPEMGLKFGRRLDLVYLCRLVGRAGGQS